MSAAIILPLVVILAKIFSFDLLNLSSAVALISSILSWSYSLPQWGQETNVVSNSNTLSCSVWYSLSKACLLFFWNSKSSFIALI